MKPGIAFLGLGVMGSSVGHVGDVRGAGAVTEQATDEIAGYRVS
jgi:hypothetical protein